MNPNVDDARDFAVAAHGAAGQLYNRLPYRVHLEEVVALLEGVTNDPAMRAAGWLHDSLEDLPEQVTFETLSTRFGVETAELVREVSKVSRPSDGNRAVRVAKDLEHYSRASPRGKTVKLADVTANLRRVKDLPLSFARVYVLEKATLVDRLRGGDPALLAAALVALKDAQAYLAPRGNQHGNTP